MDSSSPYIKPEPQVETVVEEVAKAEETPAETKEEIYTQNDLEEAKEWDVTLMDGLEEEPMAEEVEERDEEHELDLVLNEIAEDLQEELLRVEEPINEETPQVVSGYYGDIVIDGNGMGASESDILPVNSNVPTRKNTGIIDNAGSVHLNPTAL